MDNGRTLPVGDVFLTSFERIPMQMAVSRSIILDEIRRTTEENGGRPLGQGRFSRETGIKEYDWKSYWARWGDALVEAGFAPNQLQSGISKEELLKRYAELAMELGHLPVHGEFRLKRRADSTFPSIDAFQNRFGCKRELIRAVAEFCKSVSALQVVENWCEQYLSATENANVVTRSRDSSKKELDGAVYLAKSGRYYKIGKSNAAGRREYELGLQLPERLKMLHVILRCCM